MANRLREHRENKGSTLKDVAIFCNVDHSTVSEWERGIIAPRPPKKKLLAEFYGTQVEDLFPITTLRRATHSGILNIGGQDLECAVLDDGTRVLSGTAVFKAFGRKRRGVRSTSAKTDTGIKLPGFVDANNLKPFINQALMARITPVEFTTQSGQVLSGYECGVLPAVCEVYLRARDNDALTPNQIKLAIASDALVRSLAQVGISALIDEATGFQYDREKKALQDLLQQYLAKELQPWAKAFPDEFYQEMFRLKGWDFPIVNRPGIVGTYTNDLIYERLAPGVLEELEKRNPKKETGRRKSAHHQHLTPDLGTPALKQHISHVTVIMKSHENWDGFQKGINRAIPKVPGRIAITDAKPDDTP